MIEPFRRPLRSLRRLRPGDGSLFLRAVGYCMAMRLALWLVPAPVLLRHVRSRVDSAAPPDKRVPPVAQLAWAVRAAGRRVPRSTCLVEALAVQLLLARYGHSSRLCIGVRRDPGSEFQAHAWVEVDDRIVVGARRGEWYSPLPDFGPVLESGLLR